MSEQMVRYETNSMAEIERAATAMVKSKFFQDAAEVNQAIVKIMAGQEIGIGAFASMTGIHIIKGKPTYGANILAAKVKGSGRYDYRVKEISEKACEVEFFQNASSLGCSRFTIEDARKAGTQNVDKFPRNMLFARAISNGIKWFCPDVLGGVTAYVPEEFGAVVDDNNMIVDAVSEPAQPAKLPVVVINDADDLDAQFPQAEQPAEVISEETYFKAFETLSSKGEKYGDHDSEKLRFIANNPKTPAEKKAAALTLLKWRASH